jgi:phospholipase/carboxylesterase
MSASSAERDFIYRFIPARQEGLAPLLLLHGTGGNENDLLDLAEAVAPGRAVISPRGKVLENGMPRFFRRLAEGVFDEADVVRRAHELADFVGKARTHHALPAPMALGFSNGANIAAAMLLLRPEALSGGILIRAMTPLKAVDHLQLDGRKVLILSGMADPIIPAADAANLSAMLTTRGAKVTHETLAAGHGLTREDINLSRTFLDSAG